MNVRTARWENTVRLGLKNVQSAHQDTQQVGKERQSALNVSQAIEAAVRLAPGIVPSVQKGDIQALQV